MQKLQEISVLLYDEKFLEAPMESERLVALHFTVDSGFASVSCDGQSVLVSIEHEGQADGIEWPMREAEQIAAAIQRLVQQYPAYPPDAQIGTTPDSGGDQISSSIDAPRTLLCVNTSGGMGKW